MFIWRHFPLSSVLLLRVEPASACKIVSFSLRHKLQDFAPVRYGAVWATMLHFMLGFFSCDNRIEQLPEKPAFIALKDHKSNFCTNPKCRFINPTKSNLGKVSIHILDNVNISIRQSTGLQQWRNTTAVISWFNNFPSKEKCKFLSFDFIDFYPSISEQLLTDVSILQDSLQKSMMTKSA